MATITISTFSPRHIELVSNPNLLNGMKGVGAELWDIFSESMGLLDGSRRLRFERSPDSHYCQVHVSSAVVI